MKRWSLLLVTSTVVSLIALTGCNVLPGDIPPPPAEVCQGTHTVRDLQDPTSDNYTRLAPTEGCDFCAEGCSESMPVKLCGVVATTDLMGKLRDGEPESFFVSDAEGGLYSGIKIYVPAGLNFTDVKQGDELTLIGSVEEFCGITEIQIQEQFITHTGTNREVPAALVAASTCAIGEAHEGSLVTLDPARPMIVTAGPNYFGETEVDHCSRAVLDDDWFDYTCRIGAGTFIDSATGVIDNAWGSWRLYPRANKDLVLFNEPKPPPSSTISQLQNCSDPGFLDPASGPVVYLENILIVTPHGTDDRGIYAMDPAGGAWSGLYMYNRDGWGDTGLEPGDMINVRGTASEFYGTTEITVDSCGLELVAKDVPLPELVHLDTGLCPLADARDNGCPNAMDDNFVGEQYEGSLVRVTNGGQPMCITRTGTGWAELDNCFATELDDTFGVPLGGIGSCYTEIIGIIAYSFGSYTLSPVGPADLVP